MAESPRTAYPRWAYVGTAIPSAARVGAVAAVACAWVYGLPYHAVAGLAVMALATAV